MSARTRDTRRSNGEGEARFPSGQLSEAARRYADAIAIDDAAWVRAFLMALNGGARLLLAGSPVRNPTDADVPSAALLQYGKYAANARLLYDTEPAAVSGAVVVRSHEHQECIMVRAGGGVYAGVVVAPRAVLTTAFVAQWGEGGELVVGRGGAAPAMRIGVERAVVHHAFDAETHAADIGLLLLECSVPGVRRAQLAPDRSIDAAVYAKTVGFGHGDRSSGVPPGVKRAVLLPLIPAVSLGDHERALLGCHAGTELLAGKPALTRDGCMNNGGEPLYVRHANRWCVAGILSRPMHGHQLPCGPGDIYTRVDRAWGWIRTIIGDDGE